MDTERPLVIVYVGGGLVQDTTAKDGTGLPRVHVLDYDREGQYDDELSDFVEEIAAARDDLAAYNDPADKLELLSMAESIEKFQQLVTDGETAGRYR